MIGKQTISAAILLGSLLLFPLANASAQSYLKCLEQSKGKVLNWNKAWGGDQSDQGLEYQVKKIDIINKIPDRIVTLELRTKEKAAKRVRKITVKTEERARPICKSLDVKKRSVGNMTSAISSQPAEYTLPFIRYTKDGWVRSKRPPRVLELSVCRVHKREFSCLSDEKERFGIMLRTVEEEIRWSGT